MAIVVPIRTDVPATVTRTEMRSGVGVVSLTGNLCAEVSQDCCCGMAALLRRRPHTVVLDLAATSVSATAADLVEFVARHVRRHGAELWLARVPQRLGRDLARSSHGGAYRVMPTVDVAAQFAHDEAAWIRRRPDRP